MLSTTSRLATRAFHTSSRLSAAASEQAITTATKIPGVIGEYGVTAGHAPVLAQLKPGVIKVHVEREKDVQSFFTAGGFALTHANSVTDIACVELVKVEDIDPEKAQADLATYQAKLASAPEGSEEKLNAQIGVDTLAAMVAAVVSN
ncbi:unnamed protein product [Peronospora belbahrii]|uniref:ATP synthase F1 complex delta/epsilon subunit N-terminal domain-containing protein n=1 Tax=Peronospora belbahrii TaxID=622444 RepID=A0ABN8CXN0_9STRA|nr:unnamed protein product [Peronospora belbahrii]